jgi:hypothetical protein
MRLREILRYSQLVAGSLLIASCANDHSTGHVIQSAVTPGLAMYVVGDTVTINYDSMPGNARDWIAVSAAGSANNSYIKYVYTGGLTAGSVNFTNLPVGNYEARAYVNDTYSVLFRASFSITASTAAITTNQSSYIIGNNIVASFSGISTPSATDWVSIAAQNSASGSYITWAYTNGQASGSHTFSSTYIPAGTYVARLYRNNSTTIAAQSAPFTLSAAMMSTPDVTVQMNVVAGTPFTINYTGMPGYMNDWVSVAIAGTSDSSFVNYFYTNGNTSGQLTFPGLNAGNYEARGYVNNGTTVQVRKSFTVAPSAPRLLSPRSSSTVPTRRPTFRWLLLNGIDGARVDICSDRACGTVVHTFTVTSSTSSPAADLPTGTLFWRAFGTKSGSVGTVASPVWQFTIGANTTYNTPSSRTVPLDVNGDGYADLVAGAYKATVGGATNAGRVHLYAGSSSGLPTSPTTSLSAPDGTENRFGHSVSSAGDVNGDGYGDLIVGGYAYATNTGRAYVFHGSASGIPTTPSTTLTGPDGAEGYFGAPVAAAGDVNGDGYGDVVIGASGASSNVGRAYVYLGSASGLSGTPSVTLNAPDGANSEFGSSATMGDVNGDGYADVIVSAVIGCRVHVYLGSPTGIGTSPNVSLTGTIGDRFGHALATGDANGDGYADVAVGAIYASTGGRTYLYLGSSTGLATTPSTTLDGPNGADTSFGRTIAFGDVNNDGLADLIVGAFIPKAGVNGWVNLYRGTSNGVLSSTATQTFAGPAVAYSGFGTAIATVGDSNRDGQIEIAVGSYNDDTGRVYVYTSNASVFTTVPTVTLIGPDDILGRFGISVF